MSTLTPSAKQRLSTTIRSLRDRLLQDIHDEADRRYRLSVPIAAAARLRTRDGFALLDEELSRGESPRTVVKIETGLRGREVRSREQLKAIFDELEERIGPYLDKQIRVRIH